MTTAVIPMRTVQVYVLVQEVDGGESLVMQSVASDWHIPGFYSEADAETWIKTHGIGKARVVRVGLVRMKMRTKRPVK